MPNSDLLNIGLHTLDLEGQSRHDVVDEADRGLLVAAWVGAQDSEPGAVVDGGELVVLLAPQTLLAKGFDELHVDLQLVPGPLLLIPLPPQAMTLVPLGGGQPVQPEPFQDPPHPGHADGDVVVAGQVHGDLGRPEVVVLPQPQNLLDHLGLGDPRGGRAGQPQEEPAAVARRRAPGAATPPPQTPRHQQR